MADHPILNFINVLEDDKPRLSLTKLGLWGAMLANIGNVFVQGADQVRAAFTDTPGHPNLALLVATGAAHAFAAAKAEMKRYTVEK